MPNQDLEALITDVSQRVQSMGEAVSPEKLKALITDLLPTVLQGDNEFIRKMRFAGAGGGDARLLGTKYYRWGLSLDDVEWLFDFQESVRGLKRVNSNGFYDGPTENLKRTFDALSSAFYLPQEKVVEMDRRAIDEMFPRIPLSWFPESEQELAKRGAWELTPSYQRALRAMDTAESGYGSQLIGAGYVGSLWEAARRDSLIFNLIDTFEMTAPTEYLPVEVDIPEMLFVGESTDYNSSDYATGKTGSNRVSVAAKKFVIHQKWSGELDEDSIIPYVPFLRRQQMFAVKHYSDSAVLNGDTTNAGTGNINLDDADPADTKHYLAFDGIRHAGIVDNTANKKDLAGPITLAALLAARGRMRDATNMVTVNWGKPTDPNDLIYVADDDTADQIALLDEVLTIDKYGQAATVLTGEVAKIGRHPLIASMAMSKTEADGKLSTTGSSNVKGQVATFNRRGFKVGWRRRIKTESERLLGTDQTRIISSLRMGFGRYSPTGAASGIEAADVIYNITLP